MSAVTTEKRTRLELEEARRKILALEAERDRLVDRAERAEEALWRCVSIDILKREGFEDLAAAMQRAARGE